MPGQTLHTPTALKTDKIGLEHRSPDPGCRIVERRRIYTRPRDCGDDRGNLRSAHLRPPSNPLNKGLNTTTHTPFVVKILAPHRRPPTTPDRFTP